MKILAPLSSEREVLPLIKSGADELYCGIIPRSWFKRYSALDTLSRRGGFDSNFSSFSALEEAVKISHAQGVPVFAALNVSYVTEQYSLLTGIIDKLCNIGIDAFLVSDIGLLLLIKKLNIKKEVHVSTLGNVFNSNAVRFYEELGAKRIVLPRHLTLSEIESLVKKSESSGLEFEAFIMGSLCHNIDGLCHFFHNCSFRKKGAFKRSKKLDILYTYDMSCNSSVCSMEFSRLMFNAETNNFISRACPGNLRGSNKNYTDACGICMIPELEKAGIKYLKVVDRSNLTEQKIKLVKLVKKSMSLINSKIEAKGYRISAKEIYKEVFGKDCLDIACYYPV